MKDSGLECKQPRMDGSMAKYREMIADSLRSLAWSGYEVAPEWEKFCSFGPDDIGSVWEKIGAIRKRPRYSMAIVSQQMAEAMNKRIESDLLNGSSPMFGMPIQVSPIMSGMTGYMVDESWIRKFSIYQPGLMEGI